MDQRAVARLGEDWWTAEEAENGMVPENATWFETPVNVCPRCGEPLTDECDPNFCEGCFQDFPMHRGS